MMERKERESGRGWWLKRDRREEIRIRITIKRPDREADPIPTGVQFEVDADPFHFSWSTLGIIPRLNLSAS
jgi:hypothetical protein